MKKLALFMVLTLFATLVARAQDKPKTDMPKPAPTKADAKPAAGMPTVDEILDKHVKALGGKEAIEKQTARAIKGTFDIEAMNLSGKFETYAKAPNKSAAVIEVPGIGTFNEVTDGAKSWSANPMTGLQEKSGAGLAAAKREADLYAALNYKKHFPKMELKGKEKVGSSEAYVIEATPASGEGGPEKLYFDVTTGLLLRHDAERETEQGKIAAETYFEDYKEVDGVKIAHTLKQVSPMYSMTMKLTEVKHNATIDEAKFNKPSGN
jgi:outer membrane lipoprotein-sorting protein